MAQPRKPLGLAVGHRRQVSVPIGNAIEAPNQPRGLLKASRSRWAAFWSSDVARAVDLPVDGGRLERWIGYVDEWHRATRQLRGERVVEGSMGQPVMHPLAGYVAQLEQAIARAEQEFGMTPMARMKLGIATGEAAMTAQRLNEMTRDARASGVDVGDLADEFEEAVA